MECMESLLYSGDIKSEDPTPVFKEGRQLSLYNELFPNANQHASVRIWGKFLTIF